MVVKIRSRRRVKRRKLMDHAAYQKQIAEE